MKIYNTPDSITKPNIIYKKNKNITNVIENYIVEDLRKINNKEKIPFSESLKKQLKNIEFKSINLTQNLQKFLILHKNEELLSMEYNPKDENIKLGFSIGKAGLFSTIEVKNNNKPYVIILPEGSELKTESGLHVKVNKRNNLSFKGASATVNVFYKSTKTKNSINKFIENQKTSNIFKNIETLKEDFSKNFHPYILAGGFGTRLEIISHQRGDNKPSTITPIKNWDLMHFNLFNLYKTGLMPQDVSLNYYEQKVSNGSAGCFIGALGYEIERNNDSLNLVKTKEQYIPQDKNALIVTADGLTDMDYSAFLSDYLKKDDAAMMLVGIPVNINPGGLIIKDENNVVKEFIEKPAKEDLDKAKITILNKQGKIETYRDKEGKPYYLGNAFIHIINPDIFDTLANIYRDKIQKSYNNYIKQNGNNISEENYSKIIEGIWGRDFIPKLIELSEAGKLKNKNGKNLKIYTYEALKQDWDDIGNYNTYYNAIRKVADDKYYVNMPTEIKEEIKNNINNNILFSSNFKEDFKNFIGQGYTQGQIIVTEKI